MAPRQPSRPPLPRAPSAAVETEAEEAATHRHEPLIKAKGLEQPVRASQLHYTAPTAEGGIEQRDVGAAAGTTLTAEELGSTPEERPLPLRVGQEVQDVPRRQGLSQAAGPA